jgi:hypothetical protein
MAIRSDPAFESYEKHRRVMTSGAEYIKLPIGGQEKYQESPSLCYRYESSFKFKGSRFLLSPILSIIVGTKIHAL